MADANDRNFLLEARKEWLQENTEQWMIQHGIPVEGEVIRFTIEVNPRLDPKPRVAVMRRFEGRVGLSAEEWNSAINAVKPEKQKALLKFLYVSPEKRCSRRILMRAGFTYSYLRSPVNRTLKNAGLPFALAILPGQEKLPGWERNISLVAL